jgi:hypothetical protein
MPMSLMPSRMMTVPTLGWSRTSRWKREIALSPSQAESTCATSQGPLDRVPAAPERELHPELVAAGLRRSDGPPGGSDQHGRQVCIVHLADGDLAAANVASPVQVWL